MKQNTRKQAVPNPVLKTMEQLAKTSERLSKLLDDLGVDGNDLKTWSIETETHALNNYTNLSFTCEGKPGIHVSVGYDLPDDPRRVFDLDELLEEDLDWRHGWINDHEDSEEAIKNTKALADWFASASAKLRELLPAK